MQRTLQPERNSKTRNACRSTSQAVRRLDVITLNKIHTKITQGIETALVLNLLRHHLKPNSA